MRTVLILACAALALPLAAQQRGPLPPPPPGTVVPSSAPSDSAKTNAGRQDTSSHITNEPPAIPVEQIIQKFTQHEEEFRKERDNFTYTQIFVFQEIDENGRPDGEYRLTSDILFTPAGKRYEKVVELPKYDVKYVGREQVDEVGTYVFDIAPKKMEKSQRYLQGRIWVEDRDLQIVKTRGKATGLLKKKEDQAFPTFETFRENIESHYWFPTYTRADDILRFKSGQDVHIRLSVRYQNYKRFGSTIKIGKATQVDPEKP